MLKMLHLSCRSHCYNAMGLHEAAGDCINNVVVRMRGGNVYVLAHLLAISYWTRGRCILRTGQISSFIPEEQLSPGTPEAIMTELLGWLEDYRLGHDNEHAQAEISQEFQRRLELVRVLGSSDPSLSHIRHTVDTVFSQHKFLAEDRVVGFQPMTPETMPSVDQDDPFCLPTDTCSSDGEGPDGEDDVVIPPLPPSPRGARKRSRSAEAAPTRPMPR